MTFRNLSTTYRRIISILAVAILFLSWGTVQAEQPKQPERAIIDLGKGIYRFQNGPAYSTFIVGKEGLLMTDPINAEAATWLRAEIDRRFGKLPVRYLVYSHNHPDHVSGGEVFRDPGTVIISQELAAEDILRNKLPTAAPTITFSDRFTINFEGRPVELAYYGPNNGHGSISLYVPDAKFLFVVDWIVLKRLPWKELYYYDLDGTIASIHKVLELDFDLIAPGHNVVGNKNDVREALTYLESLRAAVMQGMNEGKTVAQMQKEIRFPAYAGYAQYEAWLPLNIKGAYDQLERVSARYGQEK